MNTNRLSNRHFGILLMLTLLLAVGASAVRGQAEEKWTHFTTAGDELSAAVPPETILVHEDKDRPHFYLSTQEVRIEITRMPNRGPSDSSLAVRPGRRNRGQETTFELGNVVGHVNVSERPNRYATVIYASSKKYSYYIGAFARVPKHPRVVRFLASLKFGGKHLMTIPGQDVETAVGVQRLEKMPSSPIVKEFLSKGFAKDAKVTYAKVQDQIPVALPDDADREESNPNETRSLLVLKMVLPRYVPSGERRVSGSVAVQVTLKANGEVGDIVADPTLDRGLAEAAANAAKQIRFIPAEVGGKPVDIVRRFVYGFAAR